MRAAESRKHVCERELHHSGGMRERRVRERDRERSKKSKGEEKVAEQTGKSGTSGERRRKRWLVVV